MFFSNGWAVMWCEMLSKKKMVLIFIQEANEVGKQSRLIKGNVGAGQLSLVSVMDDNGLKHINFLHVSIQGEEERSFERVLVSS